MLQITNVNVFVDKKDNKIESSAGWGRVQFNDFLWINFSIKRSSTGIFISWPSYKKSDGTWESYIKFQNGDIEKSKEYKNTIEKYIIDEFNKSLGISDKPNKALVTIKTNSSKSADTITNFDTQSLVNDDDDDDDDLVFQQSLYKGK